MKRVERAQIKGTAIPTLPNAAARKANVKSDTEILSRKISAKGLRGPSVKYGQHDLREQNRLLVSANEDLQRQISEMKEYVAVLEQRCSDVQEENSEINKKLRDCHALIIAEHIDPVSGEKTEQTEDQRKELMTVSKKLMSELKLFDEVAREHGTHLAEMQNTMRSLKEARDTLHLNRETFCVDTEQMERALEEAERLLLE
ncbi:small kinetochore-associated protein [Colossoma macropomum]|uniref:small kinetochore-associated protein n=1 Tax=Colossoma macropomum TaxID=42526 RepID=UPI0018640631|nr:small kinetochore-associated protein [Colossoma macropomum]XP_036418364.1 small kinetochore-associated protein [Colossoma macropomum]